MTSFTGTCWSRCFPGSTSATTASMSTTDDKQAVSAYRVRLFLMDLSPSQLRNVIAIEREHKRAFGRVAELAREELARRGEQP